MSDFNAKDYEVGYGKPPRHTQFKPGQSGNPNGRSKANKDFYEDVHDELKESITIQENGKSKKITKQKALAKRLVNEGLTGKPALIKLLTSILASHPIDKEELEEELSIDDKKILEDFIRRNTNG